MSNKQEFYSNFKLYLKDGRRAACFGKETLKGKMEIFNLFCAKSDQFNKDFAKIAYNRYHNSKIYQKELHPQISYIEIKDGDSAEYTFRQYCYNTFYRKIKHTYRPMIERELLTCGDGIDIAIKGSEKRINKLGYR